MLMVETHFAASAARFCAANFYSSSRLLAHSASVIQRNKNRRGASRVKSGNGIRAAAKAQSGSDSGPVRQNAKPQRYHPFEEIAESDLLENGEATLSPAESARTIIEVNNKAMLMLSGVVNEEVHENIFLPNLPYLTDEHGNIYFQVKNDKDILKMIATEENTVEAIIGLDTAELVSEMEALGHAGVGFGIDELDDEDSDFDDDEDEEDEDDDDGDGGSDGEDEDEWVSILDEEGQDEESDESLGDWAKFETMRSSHPMYFAQKLADVVSDDPVDCMDQPSDGVVIHGLLRPAFIEEHSIIQKHKSGPESSDLNTTNTAEEQLQEGITEINSKKHEKRLAKNNPDLGEELKKDATLENGVAFYKIEMIKVHFVSSRGHQHNVEIEDFRMARPDAIVHSAAKIISHLKAGGEKTMQALKSLCWRCKGIQVEECALVGVDSLGFDLRVCSGTQVQTLRFSFKKRVSSEYSAERQLKDFLFPRAHKHQQKKEAQHTDS